MVFYVMVVTMRTVTIRDEVMNPSLLGKGAEGARGITSVYMCPLSHIAVTLFALSLNR
jgi:hypothetical protein